MIGVNNRNLRTLAIDVRASEDLVARMPPHVVAVSESGLKTPRDLAHLASLGYRAFLIGEGFMTAPAPVFTPHGKAARISSGASGMDTRSRSPSRTAESSATKDAMVASPVQPSERKVTAHG